MNIPTAARFICAMAFLLTSIKATAQPTTAPLDSVRIAYDFTPGERVTYRVVTYDTLELLRPSGPPMISRRVAERAQLMTFTCVGVLEEGYLMEMTGSRYAARERRDSMPEIVRTSHPWAERTLRFSMAPDGRRIILYSSADTPGVAPSGPFQPLLLPLLGDSVSWVGASQMFKRQHWLIDNGLPPSPYDGSVLRIVTGRRDTLGVPTLELQLDDIGSASHDPEEPDSIRVSTIASVSGASTHYFSPMLGFPVTGHMSSILKLAITTPRGSTEGRQTIVVTYEMVAAPELDTSAREDAR